MAASIAKFRIQRQSHICEMRYRAVLSDIRGSDRDVPAGLADHHGELGLAVELPGPKAGS